MAINFSASQQSALGLSAAKARNANNRGLANLEMGMTATQESVDLKSALIELEALAKQAEAKYKKKQRRSGIGRLVGAIAGTAIGVATKSPKLAKAAYTAIGGAVGGKIGRGGNVTGKVDSAFVPGGIFYANSREELEQKAEDFNQAINEINKSFDTQLGMNFIMDFVTGYSFAKAGEFVPEGGDGRSLSKLYSDGDLTFKQYIKDSIGTLMPGGIDEERMTTLENIGFDEPGTGQRYFFDNKGDVIWEAVDAENVMDLKIGDKIGDKIIAEAIGDGTPINWEEQIKKLDKRVYQNSLSGTGRFNMDFLGSSPEELFFGNDPSVKPFVKTPTRSPEARGIIDVDDMYKKLDPYIKTEDLKKLAGDPVEKLLSNEKLIEKFDVPEAVLDDKANKEMGFHIYNDLGLGQWETKTKIIESYKKDNPWFKGAVNNKNITYEEILPHIKKFENTFGPNKVNSIGAAGTVQIMPDWYNPDGKWKYRGDQSLNPTFKKIQEIIKEYGEPIVDNTQPTFAPELQNVFDEIIENPISRMTKFITKENRLYPYGIQ